MPFNCTLSDDKYNDIFTSRCKAEFIYIFLPVNHFLPIAISYMEWKTFDPFYTMFTRTTSLNKCLHLNYPNHDI